VNPSIDIEHLKKQIIDIPIKLFSKPTDKRRLKHFNVFRSHYKDFHFIAEQYNVDRLIFKKATNIESSYSLFKGNRYKTEILIRFYIFPVSRKEICKTFCHELAHHIEHMVICNSKNLKYDRSPDGYLRSELLADRLGYFIYKAYFTNFCKLTHRDFCYYKFRANENWLKKNIKKIQNIPYKLF